MTPRRSACTLAMLLLTVLLVGQVGPLSSLAANSDPRERPPYDRTPTTTSSLVAGDGTGSVDEITPETIVADAEEPPIVLAATNVSASESSNGSAIRPRPEARTFVNPASQVELPENEKSGADADAEPVIPRLDNSVLRWLPEIMASAKANDVPPELIAGVMRLESDGNPNIISPDGARGLMQIMPDQLNGQGIPDYLWHDPATNIMAGGYELLERSWSYGSWEQAVGSYFGFGCDVFGTCTAVYIRIVFDWAAYYKSIIESPLSSGFGVLPADWVVPPIVPFVEEAPTPPEEPPTATPTPILTVTVTESPTPLPSETPAPSPTELSDEESTVAPTVAPPDVPTMAPTEEPTEKPTAVPTDSPTEEPTEVQTEGPTDPPAEDGSSGSGSEGEEGDA